VEGEGGAKLSKLPLGATAAVVGTALEGRWGGTDETEGTLWGRGGGRQLDKKGHAEGVWVKVPSLGGVPQLRRKGTPSRRAKVTKN